MKVIEWTDDQGFKRRRMIRDTDDPNRVAEIGVPIEPPDIRFLPWDKIQAELHNALMDRGILTIKDIQSKQHQQVLTSAILSVFKRRLIALFRGVNLEE